MTHWCVRVLPCASELCAILDIVLWRLVIEMVQSLHRCIWGQYVILLIYLEFAATTTFISRNRIKSSDLWVQYDWAYKYLKACMVPLHCWEVTVVMWSSLMHRCKLLCSKFPEMFENFLEKCTFLFICTGQNFLKSRNFWQNSWNQEISWTLASLLISRFFEILILRHTHPDSLLLDT